VTTEQAIIGELRKLPAEKQRRVLAFVERLRTEDASRPRSRALKGIWSGLGVDLSEEDLAVARREMWNGFPRDL